MMVAAACGKEAQPAPKSALEVIKARTSVRSFTGEKLSEEQINTLLDAAMAAPTAANEQPWRFIVITDDEVKAGLYSGEVHKKMVVTAGAVIVVCGENTRLRRPHGAAPDAEPVREPNPYWYEDCSAATENLLLAATALDLGAVWLSCYPIERTPRPRTSGKQRTSTTTSGRSVRPLHPEGGAAGIATLGGVQLAEIPPDAHVNVAAQLVPHGILDVVGRDRMRG